MIKSFKNKELKDMFITVKSGKISRSLQKRCLRRLDVLDQTEDLRDLNIPGFNFHGLQGNPKRYTIHINGPWCLTFEWRDQHVFLVDLEQYH